MPSWNELVEQFDALAPETRDQWVKKTLDESLEGISQRRGNRNVVVYASGFLQKPDAAGPLIQMTHEDLNGLMSVIYGMDWNAGLTLVLHTPGGVTVAAETLVEYLRSKFSYIETIVPALAMSAGTMVALASDRIIMGRQSQLGPIDPQMPIPTSGRYVSAHSIVDQFERARSEIKDNQALAHAWAPILQTLGYGMEVEARNALAYGQVTVARWLDRYMFAVPGQNLPESSSDRSDKVAQHFSDADKHKSHGRRIDVNEVRDLGLVVELMEDDQELQEHVLTAYHLVTILFQRGAYTKLMTTSAGRMWLKGIPLPTPGHKASS